jgi:hypothetical protein
VEGALTECQEERLRHLSNVPEENGTVLRFLSGSVSMTEWLSFVPVYVSQSGHLFLLIFDQDGRTLIIESSVMYPESVDATAIVRADIFSAYYVKPASNNQVRSLSTLSLSLSLSLSL